MKHVDALSICNTILVIEENTFEDNLVICQNRNERLKKIKRKNEETELYEMRNGVIYKKVKDKLLFYVPEAMEKHVSYKYPNELGTA